ncbi:MAG: hypothetical protein JRJ57_03550 [Deltaproteobacteria bacterium]|nr:hypothetical protein [Deltaproteobacteria bacterium]
MKKLSIISLTLLVIFSGTFFGSVSQAFAQDYPKKNLRWFVGYAPGGGFDTYSRAIARTMKKYLPKGIQVIVINKPGSASQLAASTIYNAKPDGYTLGIWPMPGLYVPQMFFKPKYDVKKVIWLGTVLREPMVLAASSKSKLRNLKDLHQAKSVRLALTGFTGPEVAAPITMETLGVKTKFITGHNSSKESMLAALRGDADVVIFTYGSLRKLLLKKSFIPILLLGSDKRESEFPDLSTATEAGYPKLDVLVGAWRVIGATPGLPKERAQYLRDILWKSINDKEFLQWSKKAKRPVVPLDGIETEKALQKVLAQYDGLRGLLKKYIQ